jgi:hypothetical protein
MPYALGRGEGLDRLGPIERSLGRRGVAARAQLHMHTYTHTHKGKNKDVRLDMGMTNNYMIIWV